VLQDADRCQRVQRNAGLVGHGGLITGHGWAQRRWTGTVVTQGVMAGHNGYQPGVSDIVVLVVDMLNAYRRRDAELLIPSVEAIVVPLASLVSRARDDDAVDLIYVNDNYGHFTAGRDDLISSALSGERSDLVEPILPDDDCRLLLKVRHCAFYSTPLGYLFGQRETRRIVITGQVTEQCIVYTALDAYVRHFNVVIARDSVAHIDNDLGSAALSMIERNMGGALLTAAGCLP
jgi:nicotinamidase-related amidase